MKILLLGSVARAHGVEGEVQIYPFHPDSPLWTAGAALWWVPRKVLGVRAKDAPDLVEAEEPGELLIETVRPGPKGRLLVGFEGVRTRAQADALKGAVLGIEPEALGDPGEGSFWFWEVAGWPVVRPDGASLGTVVRCVQSYVELLEIRPPRGGETWYLPVVDEIVLEVDRGGRRIVADPPEGLGPEGAAP